MKVMKRFWRWLRPGLYGGWIGLSCTVMDIHLYSWQFWFTLIPTIILVSIAYEERK